MARIFHFILFYLYLFVPVHALNAFITPPTQGQDVLLGSQYIVSWLHDWGDAIPVTLTVFQSKNANSTLWASVILVSNQTIAGNAAIWNAQTIDNLPITHGFHFQILRGIETQNGPNSMDSGAVFLRESLTSFSSAATSTIAVLTTSVTVR
jgi:hypothetical protein